MPFEWEESDEKYTDYESANEQSASDIGSVNCPECGDKAYCIEFYPDADDPAWAYECHDCEIHITARPSKVVAHASNI